MEYVNEHVGACCAAPVSQRTHTASLRLKFVHLLLRATLRVIEDLALWANRRGWLTPVEIASRASRLDRLAARLPLPKGVGVRGVELDTCPAEWIWDESIGSDPLDRGAAILYFHGGGLVTGGLNTHRGMVARIACDAGIPVFNVAYRQLPQAHITETIEDCVDAYRHLLSLGLPGDRIVLAGDSVGAGLAFSVGLAVRDRKLPMPQAIVALSPWADFDSARRRDHANERREPHTPDAMYALLVDWGLRHEGRLDPAWSPVNHDFSGMPPALIHVGTTEVLLPDAEELVKKYSAANVAVQLELWESGIHVLPLAAPLVPESREAIGKIGRFIREALDETRTERSLPLSG
ncbi:putative carboxylesterase [Nocardia brasiliensis NBRC 14402]|uniref:alpha/beta hydrolase n=1 Tax=Nocardia brasiliensis TaxID=37326 RepID=UPI0002FBB398|nr:alpha/beta hydrolase [Nocardia brasiliensis]ASF11585.1 alpha/beta hydrolase [Nocardia brasiliensis]GAJ82665.1 putative carboxylesterase [Nocardia brasiliensis NBRC 14402]SUB09633.1 Monoterpene epsilon-lactone hydrolase [Nocardia brasiliensis]